MPKSAKSPTPRHQGLDLAEGKEALKKGKINYEGASSVLDFDQFGDVTPDFLGQRGHQGVDRPQSTL